MRKLPYIFIGGSTIGSAIPTGSITSHVQYATALPVSRTCISSKFTGPRPLCSLPKSYAVDRACVLVLELEPAIMTRSFFLRLSISTACIWGGVGSFIAPSQPTIVTPSNLPLPRNHSNPQPLDPVASQSQPNVVNETVVDIFRNLSTSDIIGKLANSQFSFLRFSAVLLPPSSL